MLKAWREAEQLREFAAALKESARSPAVPIEQKLAILRILDWIDRHANFVDPFTDVREDNSSIRKAGLAVGSVKAMTRGRLSTEYY